MTAKDKLQRASLGVVFDGIYKFGGTHAGTAQG